MLLDDGNRIITPQGNFKICLLLQAIEKERARVREVDKMMTLDERKRPYNSMYTDVEPTEEEMEAFRRKKVRSDDPMAAFLS